jgi:hypothetical protein
MGSSCREMGSCRLVGPWEVYDVEACHVESRVEVHRCRCRRCFCYVFVRADDFLAARCPRCCDRAVTEALDFLQLLGFEFHIDFDDELQVGCPPEDLEFRQSVCNWIYQSRDAMKKRVLDRAAYDKYQFVGGPFNGRRHCLSRWDGRVAMKLGRAKWAAYYLIEDGRALYAGEATSERKARDLAGVKLVAHQNAVKAAREARI